MSDNGKNGSELGRIGQRRYGGVIYEEFLPELRGKRGIAVYNEMSENDDIVGAILLLSKCFLGSATGMLNRAAILQRILKPQSLWKAA